MSVFTTLIDAHTHAYLPEDLDLLRERLIALDGNLDESDPHKWYLRGHGNLDWLLEHEKSAGIDRFALLPVSANPTKISFLNRWVSEMARTHKEIIPFGAILPSADVTDRHITELKTLGIKGIKIHSFLQKIDMNSKETDRLFSILSEACLPVLLDTLYLPGLMRAKPHIAPYLQGSMQFQTDAPTLAGIAGRHPRLTIIAAHLGCLYGWEHLGPLYELDNVYFDLSYIFRLLPAGQVLEIIRRKGADHILFGTDAPWRNPANVVSWFKNLDLDQDEFAAIAGKTLLKLIDESS